MSDTIDITNLVEQLRQTFVTWGTNLIMTEIGLVPWLAWLNLPVIRQLFVFFLGEILQVLSKAIEMQGFFMNTAIRKASQAQDFVDAVTAKTNLPADASIQDILLAEEKQMQAFTAFVRVTT